MKDKTRKANKVSTRYHCPNTHFGSAWKNPNHDEMPAELAQKYAQWHWKTCQTNPTLIQATHHREEREQDLTSTANADRNNQTAQGKLSINIYRQSPATTESAGAKRLAKLNASVCLTAAQRGHSVLQHKVMNTLRAGLAGLVLKLRSDDIYIRKQFSLSPTDHKGK